MEIAWNEKQKEKQIKNQELKANSDRVLKEE